MQIRDSRSVKTILTLGVLFFVAISADAQQPQPGEVQESLTTVAAPQSVSTESLLRYFGFKVYTVRLEVPARGIDPLSDVKHSMTRLYHRSFSAADITQAARKLLSHTPGVDFEALRSRLDQIDAVYRDVNEGDRYTLAYSPGVGTTLLLNDEALITIPGYDFAKAYFGMWLAPADPISSSLRARLLEGIGVRP